jgi:hypothetical protein
MPSPGQSKGSSSITLTFRYDNPLASASWFVTKATVEAVGNSGSKPPYKMAEFRTHPVIRMGGMLRFDPIMTAGGFAPGPQASY